MLKPNNIGTWTVTIFLTNKYSSNPRQFCVQCWRSRYGDQRRQYSPGDSWNDLVQALEMIWYASLGKIMIGLDKERIRVWKVGVRRVMEQLMQKVSICCTGLWYSCFWQVPIGFRVGDKMPLPREYWDCNLIFAVFTSYISPRRTRYMYELSNKYFFERILSFFSRPGKLYWRGIWSCKSASNIPSVWDMRETVSLSRSASIGVWRCRIIILQVPMIRYGNDTF